MNSKFILFSLAMFLMMSCGCNSIYFYETEKFALNVEARPEATRPVSGTAGMSMHVAAVVPSQKVDSAGNAHDPNSRPAPKQVKPGPTYNYEALSLISYFNLEKKDDIVDIETVLVTGRAHKDLVTQRKQAEVFNALAGVKATPVALDNLGHIHDTLAMDLDENTYPLARGLAGSLSQFGEEYGKEILQANKEFSNYRMANKELQTRGDLIKIDASAEGIDKIINYRSKLRMSVLALSTWEEQSSTEERNSDQGLISVEALNKQTAMLSQMNERMSKDESVKMAVSYYQGLFGK